MPEKLIGEWELAGLSIQDPKEIRFTPTGLPSIRAKIDSNFHCTINAHVDTNVYLKLEWIKDTLCFFTNYLERKNESKFYIQSISEKEIIVTINSIQLNFKPFNETEYYTKRNFLTKKVWHAYKMTSRSGKKNLWKRKNKKFWFQFDKDGNTDIIAMETRDTSIDKGFWDYNYYTNTLTLNDEAKSSNFMGIIHKKGRRRFSMEIEVFCSSRIMFFRRVKKIPKL